MADTTTAEAPSESSGAAAPAPAVELFKIELRIKRFDPERDTKPTGRVTRWRWRAPTACSTPSTR